jgi:hypothetical protein
MACWAPFLGAMLEGVAEPCGEFDRAMAPVLADLRQQQPELELRIEWAADGESHVAMAYDPTGCGAGLTFSASDGCAEAVATLADQVQEVVFDALWSAGREANWPCCPVHPRRHPLAAAVLDDQPVWVCPQNRHLIARIGTLGPRDASGRQLIGS